jgi:hypothetical protein
MEPEQLSYQPDTYQKYDSQIPQPKGNKNMLIIAGATMLIVAVIGIGIVLFNNTNTKSPPLTDTTETDRELSQPAAVPSSPSPTSDPTPTINPELNEAMTYARQSARLYDEWQDDIRTEYPWIKKLPLAGEQYFVYFDVDEDAFIGKIYTESPESIEQIKKQARADLTSREIMFDGHQFIWKINPEE